MMPRLPLKGYRAKTPGSLRRRSLPFDLINEEIRKLPNLIPGNSTYRYDRKATHVLIANVAMVRAIAAIGHAEKTDNRNIPLPSVAIATMMGK